MESIIKICANENEIKNATDKLKKDVRWGNSYFIKQGLSIFNKIHELYPDLRHGSTETSKMATGEAEYWVETISAVIKYTALRCNAQKKREKDKSETRQKFFCIEVSSVEKSEFSDS